MKKNKFNIIIPIILEDVEVFNQNIDFILEYLPTKNIVVIGKKDVETLLNNNSKIIFIDEDKILKGLTLENINELKYTISGNNRRSGWYFQQFIKMAYSKICEDEYYLIWDSDTIPTQKIEFFNDQGIPYLAAIPYQKFDNAYFKTMECLLENNILKKRYKESFVTEHMIIKTDIMRNLIFDLENNKKINGVTFYEKIMNCIDIKDINLSGFSEFETYAAYALNVYEGMYTIREWKNLRFGKVIFGKDVKKEQLQWISSEFHTISIEKFNKQWLILKLIINNKKILSIKFFYIYFIIKPLIQNLYNIRMLIRGIVKK